MLQSRNCLEINWKQMIGKHWGSMFPQMFPCLPTRGNIVAETFDMFPYVSH
jgi:hypothetical protein